MHRPVPPSGYFLLGDYLQTDFGPPNGRVLVWNLWPVFACALLDVEGASITGVCAFTHEDVCAYSYFLELASFRAR